MRIWMPEAWIRTAVLVGLVGASAFAQTDTLKLVNAGAGYVMGGVYTSPYGISINGGSPVLLICDDFTTDVSLNQMWTATPTTLAAIEDGSNPGGTPKFTPVDIADYATAAVLAAELMTLPNLASEAAGEISYAIWDIFDPSLLTATASHPTGSDPYGTLTTTQFGKATDYLTQAKSLVAGATQADGSVDLSQITINGRTINGLTIYTPNPLTASQEFLQVSMPEPSYPAILGLDLLGGILLLVVFRRRLAGIFN